MTARITATLDKYKRISRLKEPWRGTKFEWVTELSGTEVSSVGEQLATEIVGGQLLSRSEQKLLGYAVRTHDGKLIEVKTCRKSFSDSNVWSWKQIRLQGGCTEFCVNGLMAGNRRTSWREDDRKSKESSPQRPHRQSTG